MAGPAGTAGAAPSQDDLEVARLRLSACRRYVLAAVVVLFPTLFVVDEWLTAPFSPVLPGLLVLALVLAVAPFPLMAFLVRQARRRGTLGAAVPVYRMHGRATSALLLASLLFLVWLGWEA